MMRVAVWLMTVSGTPASVTVAGALPKCSPLIVIS
jgi:hypothetical protein